jgi:hypothetical protein
MRLKRKLEGVKPGDKIKVRHNYGVGFNVHEVERVTESRAICTSGAAFMINSGALVGTAGLSRGKRYGSFATDEDFNKAAIAQRLISAQAKIDRFRVTAANLEAVEALLEGAK